MNILKNQKVQIGFASTIVLGGLGYYLIKEFKNRSKYSKQIQELEQLVTNELQKTKAELYSFELVNKIHTMILEINAERYAEFAKSSRQKRREFLNKDVNAYIDLLEEYSKEYSEIIDGDNIFKKSKVLNFETFKKSIEEVKKNQKEYLTLRISQKNDFVKLRASIPSALDQVGVQDAVEGIHYMLGIVQSASFKFKEIVDTIIKRDTQPKYIYGMISQTLYDYLSVSDKFEGIEEEDIFRFMNSPNESDKEVIEQYLYLLSTSVFKIIEYISQMKTKQNK